MSAEEQNVFDVLIVGAGPVGLAAGIEAKRSGLNYLIVEAGTLCQSLVEYPAGMRFFSPADDLAIGGYPLATPHDEKPTREIALNYYRKVAETEALKIATYERVVQLAKREPLFQAKALSQLRQGCQTTYLAANILLCTGVWGQPKRLNAPGADLPHVQTRWQEPLTYWRKRVLVVGSGNSAAEAAIRLCDAGAIVSLLVEVESLELGKFRPFILRELQMRLEEDKITLWLQARVSEIQPGKVHITMGDDPHEVETDFVILQLGMEADTSLLSPLGVEFNGEGKPLHDSVTFETCAKGVYVAGAISQEGFIFLGRDHVKKVMARLSAGKQSESANLNL